MYDLSLSFCNHGFKFQHFICNGCHDLKMLSVSVSDIAIITVKDVDYRCIQKQLIYLKILYLIVGIYKKYWKTYK